MPERERADDEMANWAKAHETLLQLARERSELEGREGRALLLAMRAKVHVHLGYGSLVEYVERLFGYSPRTTLEKLRTAEALEGLPELDQALTKGQLSWSAVRELARVAIAETERDWLDAAKGRTVRDVERLVAGHERGDRPGDAALPLAVRHFLRFEVAAETLATFRHAMNELRKQSGEHLDDDSALLLMARHVLGNGEPVGGREPVGSKDRRGSEDLTDGPGSTNICSSAAASRASYQLALTLCEQCGRGFQDACGERLEVDAAIVEMARCDAQHIGHVESTRPPPESGGDAQTHVGHPQTRVSLRATQHRATQTVPPALRRRVLCRDKGRCVVPGCRHTTFIDVHHLDLRSEGGRHDADNLVVLCTAHHRAVHHGRLGITGVPSTGLRFEHADGTPYGHAPSPHTIALLEQVFRGLRGLGFKEGEARRALDAATQEVSQEGAAPSAQDLLRAALRRLGPRNTIR
jgi:hypothetical protein